MGNQIEFCNVEKRYDKNQILKGLTFSINELEYVGLIGNNGCGKSTVINILCNLIPYDEGDVLVFNRKVTPSYVSYKSKIGAIISTDILVNEFTPWEYLKFAGMFQNVDPVYINSRIHDLLNLFKLNINKKKIENLSSGEKMRVAFSAALIHNPAILILDEPFINMDNQTIDLISTFLYSLRGKKTLFITSHNLDLLFSLCNRFLILEGGIIIESINKDDLNDIGSFKKLIRSKTDLKTQGVFPENWLK